MHFLMQRKLLPSEPKFSYGFVYLENTNLWKSYTLFGIKYE